ncbi:hypothetical protein Y1Q_0014134 [Alligator mississippiensis]|uniref:Uncharacterized protein n=1 Tax=Alligator mississippiensis TaxID=8496 RepID=A0A151MTT7_ALLMI|nr:hypothetical protein Y1Q_0014134 [Alligator mississippiensis]
MNYNDVAPFEDNGSRCAPLKHPPPPPGNSPVLPARPPPPQGERPKVAFSQGITVGAAYVRRAEPQQPVYETVNCLKLQFVSLERAARGCVLG